MVLLEEVDVDEVGFPCDTAAPRVVYTSAFDLSSLEVPDPLLESSSDADSSDHGATDKSLDPETEKVIDRVRLPADAPDQGGRAQPPSKPGRRTTEDLQKLLARQQARAAKGPATLEDLLDHDVLGCKKVAGAATSVATDRSVVDQAEAAEAGWIGKPDQGFLPTWSPSSTPAEDPEPLPDGVNPLVQVLVVEEMFDRVKCTPDYDTVVTDKHGAVLAVVLAIPKNFMHMSIVQTSESSKQV